MKPNVLIDVLIGTSERLNWVRRNRTGSDRKGYALDEGEGSDKRKIQNYGNTVVQPVLERSLVPKQSLGKSLNLNGVQTKAKAEFK